jgi:2-hydroxychromene-2-carboxylate isomerase
MADPIHFYFDFISPYGYFAAHRIEALARRHGRAVEWRAFNMRQVVSKKMGITQPIFAQPLKGDYFKQDVPRMARLFGLAMNPGDIPSFNAVPAERAFWALHDQDPGLAARFATRVFDHVFAEAGAPSAPASVAALAGDVGADAAALEAAIQEPAAKDRLNAETEAAVAHGVWGTPTFRVGDQLFWGADRLWMLEEWIARGGW